MAEGGAQVETSDPLTAIVDRNQAWAKETNNRLRINNSPKESIDPRPIEIRNQKYTTEGAFGLIGNRALALQQREIDYNQPLTASQMERVLTEPGPHGENVEMKVGEMVDDIRNAENALRAGGLSEEQIEAKKREVFNTLGVKFDEKTSPAEKKKGITFFMRKN